jgi:hypothetical protein
MRDRPRTTGRCTGGSTGKTGDAPIADSRGTEIQAARSDVERTLSSLRRKKVVLPLVNSDDRRKRRAATIPNRAL